MIQYLDLKKIRKKYCLSFNLRKNTLPKVILHKIKDITRNDFLEFAYIPNLK